MQAVPTLPGPCAALAKARAAIRRCRLIPAQRCIFWPGFPLYWHKLQPAAVLGDSFSPALRSNTSGSSTMDTAHLSAPTPAAAIDFLITVGKLKRTLRTGWVRKHVTDPESVAGSTKRIDRKDVAIDKHQEKQELERNAISELQNQLGGAELVAAREVADLWEEYESCATPEAKLVKDFDKLEMILQAAEYENEGNVDLEEFFSSVMGKMKTDLGKAWSKEIFRRRPQQRQAASSLRSLADL